MSTVVQRSNTATTIIPESDLIRLLKMNDNAVATLFNEMVLEGISYEGSTLRLHFTSNTHTTVEENHSDNLRGGITL